MWSAAAGLQRSVEKWRERGGGREPAGTGSPAGGWDWPAPWSAFPPAAVVCVRLAVTSPLTAQDVADVATPPRLRSDWLPGRAPHGTARLLHLSLQLWYVERAFVCPLATATSHIVRHGAATPPHPPPHCHCARLDSPSVAGTLSISLSAPRPVDISGGIAAGIAPVQAAVDIARTRHPSTRDLAVAAVVVHARRASRSRRRRSVVVSCPT